MDVRPFKMEDMDVLEMEAETLPLFKKALQPKHSFTGVIGGRVMFAGGVIIGYPGVAESWFIKGKDVRDHGVAIAKAAYGVLAHCMDAFGLWRVQNHVRVDSDVNRKFVETIGFTPDGKLEGFFPDRSDAILYSVVIK